MIHLIPIIWHDLQEDPFDVPKTDEEYFVLLRNRNTDEDGYFDYYPEYMAAFDEENVIWTAISDEEDGSRTTYGYGSYGLIHDVSVEDDFDYFSDYEVIAWARKPEKYKTVPSEFTKWKNGWEG